MMSELRYESEREGLRTQEKYCIEPGLFCGLVFLFSVHSGEPLAILNDGLLQQMRVGVDAGLGVKYMAREDSEVLGLFGAGSLARSIATSILGVRRIVRIQVYDPRASSSARYAEELRKAHDVEVLIVNDPGDVYRGADILAECTNSADPKVVRGRHVEIGTHIVSVGRRMDADAFLRIDRSLRFGDATPVAGQATVKDEHQLYVTPAISEGALGHSPGFRRDIDGAKIVYFKDLLDGVVGRRGPSEVTYSERGNIMGAQFHAMAGRVYELASERGAGRQVPTEWFLEDIRS
jgi:ornithine cyclodeaminase/alanine dehydrogenase-like protein (mu-crystallin family)